MLTYTIIKFYHYNFWISQMHFLAAKSLVRGIFPLRQFPLNKAGIDKVGIDKVGIEKVGINLVR